MSGENTKITRPQGGDRIEVADGGYIKRSVATPAAAGTDNTDATELTAEVNAVTGANDNAGVKLPTAEAGMEILVKNTVANKVLKVYPGAGATINALTQTTGALSMAAATIARFVAVSSTQWYSMPLLPS